MPNIMLPTADPCGKNPHDRGFRVKKFRDGPLPSGSLAHGKLIGLGRTPGCPCSYFGSSQRGA